MVTESLIKLAASGNVKGVEEAWMSFLDSDSSPEEWVERASVIKALADRGHGAEAEAMATTAIEGLAERLSESDLLAAAKPFLMVLKDSETIRKTVASIYRSLYADVEGLDALLAEAGVEGGRPPRRAIRTMDVCLQLKEGACLSHRHENTGARVEHIDCESWQIEITTGKDTQSFGAVELADNYELAEEDDFRVMAQFDAEGLTAALNDDPAAVVISILRGSGPTMDSDALRKILSPKFIAEKQWSKWWTKARQALRFTSSVKVDGRSPYYLTYDADGASFEKEVDEKLAKAHDPLKELAIIEDYVKGCKPRKQEVAVELLSRARDRIEERARRDIARLGKVDLTPWLAGRRIGELMGDEQAAAHVVEALAKAEDPVEAILAVEVPAFWPAACAALEESHPANLAEGLKRLLPHAPIPVANHLAESLITLGATPEDFYAVAEEILREPIALNEGLLWLWNGPSVKAARVSVPLVTILTRVLHAMGELLRNDSIGKSRGRQIALNTRDVLKARKHKRFQEMLEQIEPGVAMALRTQITRLHNLARTGDDLLRLIRQKFPELTIVVPQLPMWLQDDVLYVTQAGYRRKREELDELVNVKIRENAVAIGRAAELGDLSENSEYKFALEERDLLQARLAQMQKQMEIARVLQPRDVPTDHVGIGSRVVLEHSDGSTRLELNILSPWEADPEGRIVNYQTPLAQTLLGAKVGQAINVEFFSPPGEYRVVSVSSAIHDA